MNLEILILLLLASALVLLALLFLRLGRLHRLIEERDGRLEQRIEREVRGLFHQLESYSFLRDRLDLRQGLPYSRNWSASPDFLKLIAEHCLEARPSVILECSSGLTTLVLARCCQLNGQGRVYSLENGEEFAVTTRGHLHRYGLDEYATVLHAPLEGHRVNGRDFSWYALSGIPDQTIDMLVIDGPPGFIQRHSRYPALPLLFGRLSGSCAIFLDDAARQDEREIVESWKKEFPAIRHEFIRTERGCSLLRRGPVRD